MLLLDPCPQRFHLSRVEESDHLAEHAKAVRRDEVHVEVGEVAKPGVKPVIRRTHHPLDNLSGQVNRHLMMIGPRDPARRLDAPR